MKNHTKRWLLITAGLLVLLMVGTLAGASTWVRNFLRSEQFRTLVATKTGETLKSDVEISPLQWSGSSVFADKVHATGQEGAPLSRFEADQIRAEINWRSAFDGAWRVELLDILQLNAEIQTTNATIKPQKSTPPPPAPRQGFLPQRFELGAVVAGTSNIRLLAQQDEILALSGSRMSIKPDGHAWEIEGTGGTLRLPQIPELGITSFRSRAQGGAFFLTNGRLTTGSTGKISATGEFAEHSNLRLEWTGVDIQPWLPSEWKSRLSGQSSGTTVTRWGADGFTKATTTGEFLITEGRIEQVPLLEQIARFTGSPQFKRMPVQEISAKFSYSNAAWTFTDVVIESKGLMRVEGICSVQPDGAINGTFRVGVTPQTLQWIPGSQERVFTTTAHGYVWTDVRIGGTTANITEDLSPRLAAAMKDEVIGVATDTLKNAPETIQKGASDVLNILTPLLR